MNIFLLLICRNSYSYILIKIGFLRFTDRKIQWLTDNNNQSQTFRGLVKYFIMFDHMKPFVVKTTAPSVTTITVKHVL